MRTRFMAADEAAALIGDGRTVALVGGGGGLMEASCLFAAVERRFLTGRGPRDLTLVHSLGIGDRDAMGLNRFAHEGLVRRVIGGHWVWSPRMQALAQNELIEAYALPGGVVMQLYREIGARRPGLLSRTGLGTFVDPRIEGGRMNRRARDSLVEVVSMRGAEYLLYKSFPIDVALIRGSFADAEGNISLAEEAAKLDIQSAALAARNSGGLVIAQVRARVAAGALPAHSVFVPGAWVDAVVVDPDQCMTYDIVADPAMAGIARGEPLAPAAPVPDVRHLIARRATAELRDGAVVNYGFGIPDAVARLVAASGRAARYVQTIEHGIYGGELLDGALFGFSRNASAMIDGPTQFDFYAGGGLDIAFLGFGEIDAQGNVNVSKLGHVPVGPGGFIDIAQNARKVVFCGTFDTGGTQCEIASDRIAIRRSGAIRKLVAAVDQITFSGPQAIRQGQEVVYVTERAVFTLSAAGVALTEVAAGIDLQRDILAQMDFAPLITPGAAERAAAAAAGWPPGSQT